LIEGEPSFPLTGTRFDEIRRAFDFAKKYPGLKGVMGNVQTLFIQLPHIFLLTRAAWSEKLQNEDDLTILRSLARLIFPQKSDLLAGGWSQLKLSGSKPSLEAVGPIEAMLKSGQTGRLGTLGNSVFPGPTQILRDLAAQLRIHATAEHVKEQVTAGSSEDAVKQALVAYFRELLGWQNVNGFWGAYGVNKQVIYDRFMHGPDYLTVKSAWEQFVKERKDQKQIQASVVKSLSDHGYTPWIVASFTGQFFGTYQVKNGEIEKKIFRKLPPAQELNPWSVAP
jgi:hypothetical protein